MKPKSDTTEPLPVSGDFPAGTFTPQAQRAPISRIVRAQGKIESKLFLRHAEQQLLSIVIPFLVLVGLTLVPALEIDHPIRLVFPLTLAISAMSAGFTGQSIAVAFDRRYGALKRLGACAVPPWAIVSGKIVGVWVVSIGQTLFLGATALVLGWRTSWAHIIPAIIVLALGVAAFTSLGLALGGTLNSELVLGLGNLIWFLLAGTAGYVLLHNHGSVPQWLHVIPSVALADGISQTFSGHWPWLQVIALVVWIAIGGLITKKFFRYSS